MNYVFAFVVAIALIALAGCNDYSASSQVLANARSYPGFMQPDQCFPFARSVVRHLQESGLQAEVISFHYRETSPGTRFGSDAVVQLETGRVIWHAIAMWKEANGEVYGVDNYNTYPVWLDPRGRKVTPARMLRRVQVMYPTAFELTATPEVLFHAETTTTPLPGGQR